MQRIVPLVYRVEDQPTLRHIRIIALYKFKRFFYFPALLPLVSLFEPYFLSCPRLCPTSLFRGLKGCQSSFLFGQPRLIVTWPDEWSRTGAPLAAESCCVGPVVHPQFGTLRLPPSRGSFSPGPSRKPQENPRKPQEESKRRRIQGA